MHKILLFIVLLFNLLYTGCTYYKEYIPIHKSTIKLQNFLDKAIQEHKLIGLQVAIKTNEGLQWQGSSGTIDINRKVPMKNKNTVRIGSITKTFTAVLIFQLIEQNKLNLNDKIDKWFPNLPNSNKITVKMLLNHSSGIAEVLNTKIMLLSLLKPNKIWNTDEIMDIINSNKYNFQPSTNYEYSNSNYILLGQIAEKVSGIQLNILYRKKILEPLSLKNTYFIPYENPPKGLINGYDRDLIPLPGYQKITPLDTSWSTIAYSSGAMISNASDLLTFFDAILNRRIINEKSYQSMITFQKVLNPIDGYFKYYGLGLLNSKNLSGNLIGHGGLFPGSVSIVVFDPKKNFTIAIIANVSQFDEMKLLKELISIVSDVK